MRTAVFSARPYDRRSLNYANEQAGSPHSFDFLDDLDSGSLTGSRLAQPHSPLDTRLLASLPTTIWDARRSRYSQKGAVRRAPLPGS